MKTQDRTVRRNRLIQCHHGRFQYISSHNLRIQQEKRIEKIEKIVVIHYTQQLEKTLFLNTQETVTKLDDSLARKKISTHF